MFPEPDSLPLVSATVASAVTLPFVIVPDASAVIPVGPPLMSPVTDPSLPV
jgi:hypothetical protein